MGYLDELRKMCAEMTEVGKSKEDVERVTKLENIANGLENEQKEILKANGELKEAYKKAIMHTSFDNSKPNNEEIDTQKPISFEEVLNDFIENEKKKEKK